MIKMEFDLRLSDMMLRSITKEHYEMSIKLLLSFMTCLKDKVSKGND